MKLSALLADIATALANDTALEAYCQTNFTKSPSIFVHLDPKNPPSISKAPYIGLTIQQYSRPVEANARVIDFTLEAGCYIDNKKEKLSNSNKVSTLEGFAMIEDFSDLVFAAIEKAVTTSSLQLNMSYRSEDTTLLAVGEFPGWVASRNFIISKNV